jgi:hypothetical protein
MGLKVATLLLEDEANRRCVQRYQRLPERTVTGYGRENAFLSLACGMPP